MTNTIKGTAGPDRLTGVDATAADTGVVENDIHGGGGNDVVTGGASADWPHIALNRLYGDEGADTISGGKGAENTIYGGSGDDRVIGGEDADNFVYGGTGDDHLVASTAYDELSGDDGDDYLDGGSSSEVRLDGGAGRDVLIASDLADNWSSLDGGEGADTMVGNAADDWYYVDDAGDVVREATDASAFDSVDSAVTYVLPVHVEDLYLHDNYWEDDAAIDGTGNDQANWIVGNDAANRLHGLGGDDFLFGQAGDDMLEGGGGRDEMSGDFGDDLLFGGDGRDRLMGDSGDDRLSGGFGNDKLSGGGNADTLFGGGGNDTLAGGTGRDVLTGGRNGDRFRFEALHDTGKFHARADRITDFSQAQGDRIDLKAIDADATQKGNQAFTFIGAAAFSNVAGQLHYQTGGGHTYLSGDVDGDGRADFVVRSDKPVAFVAGDFVL